jgi:hypothetical protein
MARVNIGGQSGWTTLALAQQAASGITQALQNYLLNKRLKEQQAKLANLKEILAPVLAKRLGVVTDEDLSKMLSSEQAQLPTELAQKKQFIEGLKEMPIEYYKYLNYIAPVQPKETKVEYKYEGLGTKRGGGGSRSENLLKDLNDILLILDRLETTFQLPPKTIETWKDSLINEATKKINKMSGNNSLKKLEKQNKNTSNNNPPDPVGIR